MISYTPSTQQTIAAFDWPFHTALDPENRWVVLGDLLPWEAMTNRYHATLTEGHGRPAKSARLVIGAVIIKHKLVLSDRETVSQIQENPYLQYFVGLPGYQMVAPFAPSLFVEIRKRMGDEVFESFHEAIIASVDAAEKRASSHSNKGDKEDEGDKGSPFRSGFTVRTSDCIERG